MTSATLTGKPRRHGPLLAVAALVIAAAAFALVRHLASPGPPVIQVSPALAPKPLSADPLIDGRSSTIAAAEASTPYPVYQPDTPLASSVDLGNVWINALTTDEGQVVHQVALYYPSAGVEFIERPAEFTSPSAKYAAWQREFGAKQTSITSINGVHAFTIAHVTDPMNGNPASVHIVLDGVYIQILGNRPVSDLVQVASSLAAPAQPAN